MHGLLYLLTSMHKITQIIGCETVIVMSQKSISSLLDYLGLHYISG